MSTQKRVGDVGAINRKLDRREIEDRVGRALKNLQKFFMTHGET